MAKRTHSSITAPLKKMLKKLLTHIDEHNSDIVGYNNQKAEIDTKISYSESEIKASKNTADHIKKMIGEE